MPIQVASVKKVGAGGGGTATGSLGWSPYVVKAFEKYRLPDPQSVTTIVPSGFG